MYLFKFKPGTRQQGISLVELLIAIALGLFLVWGVMQSFLTSRQSYRLQQGLGRIQENGRLAQEFLGYEIRNAGDYACVNSDDFVTAAFDLRGDLDCSPPAPALGGTVGINMMGTVDFSNQFEYAVYGFNNDDGMDRSVETAAVAGTTIRLGTAASPRNPRPASDVLVLRLADELGVLTAATDANIILQITDLTGDRFTINRRILPAESNTWAAQQPVMISDCVNQKVFAIQPGDVTDPDPAGSMTSSFALSPVPNNYCARAAFAQGASVRKLTTVYYFVSASIGGGGNFSLYRQQGDNAIPDELLEGVDDMQLTFGVDTDGDGIVDIWRDANNVAAGEWNGWDFDPVTATKDLTLVRAVRYSLLLRTSDPVLGGETQTLSYNDQLPVTYTDGIMRQVFTSSVGIRSRVQ